MGFQATIQDGLLNWIRGLPFPTAPTATYLSFHSSTATDGNDEVSANLGGRLTLTGSVFTTPGVAPSGGRQITNNRSFITDLASAATTVQTFAIWSQLVGGDRLWTGDVVPDVTIAQGDPGVFLAGSLILRVLP